MIQGYCWRKLICMDYDAIVIENEFDNIVVHLRDSCSIAQCVPDQSNMLSDNHGQCPPVQFQLVRFHLGSSEIM